MIKEERNTLQIQNSDEPFQNDDTTKTYGSLRSTNNHNFQSTSRTISEDDDIVQLLNGDEKQDFLQSNGFENISNEHEINDPNENETHVDHPGSSKICDGYNTKRSFSIGNHPQEGINKVLTIRQTKQN